MAYLQWIFLINYRFRKPWLCHAELANRIGMRLRRVQVHMTMSTSVFTTHTLVVVGWWVMVVIGPNIWWAENTPGVRWWYYVRIIFSFSVIKILASNSFFPIHIRSIRWRSNSYVARRRHAPDSNLTSLWMLNHSVYVQCRLPIGCSSYPSTYKQIFFVLFLH